MRLHNSNKDFFPCSSARQQHYEEYEECFNNCINLVVYISCFGIILKLVILTFFNKMTVRILQNLLQYSSNLSFLLNKT